MLECCEGVRVRVRVREGEHTERSEVCDDDDEWGGE